MRESPSPSLHIIAGRPAVRIRPIDARPALLARVLVYGNLLPHSHVSPRTHRSAFSVLLNHTRPTPRSPHRISETYSAAAMADEMTLPRTRLH